MVCEMGAFCLVGCLGYVLGVGGDFVGYVGFQRLPFVLCFVLSFVLFSGSLFIYRRAFCPMEDVFTGGVSLLIEGPFCLVFLRGFMCVFGRFSYFLSFLAGFSSGGHLLRRQR